MTGGSSASSRKRGKRLRLTLAVAALLVVAAAPLARPTEVSASWHGMSFPVVGNYGAMCLDDYNWSTSQNAPIVLWPCNGYSNQDWYLRFYQACQPNGYCWGYNWFLLNAYSGKCLSLAYLSGSNGVPLVQKTCTGYDNTQHWSPTRQCCYDSTTFRETHLNSCIDAPNDDPNGRGRQVWAWGCNGTYAQWWSTNPQGQPDHW